MDASDLAVTRERIAAELAVQTGQLDLSGLKLTELPPELRGLTSFQSLNCSRTKVSDLEPLPGLTSFQHLCQPTAKTEPLPGTALAGITTSSSTRAFSPPALRIRAGRSPLSLVNSPPCGTAHSGNSSAEATAYTVNSF